MTSTFGDLHRTSLAAYRTAG